MTRNGKDGLFDFNQPPMKKNLTLFGRVAPPLIQLLFFLALCSCSFVSYKKVDATDDSEGFRYYHSSPYFLVYSNGKGGIVTQIIYIADPYKKVSARPRMFLSNMQTSMEFDKGVYKSSKNTYDASVVPSAILKAVQTIAPALLAALNDPVKDSRSIPAPYLYKIVINGTTVEFIGGQGDASIKVNLLEQKADQKK